MKLGISILICAAVAAVVVAVIFRAPPVRKFVVGDLKAA